MEHLADSHLHKELLIAERRNQELSLEIQALKRDSEIKTALFAISQLYSYEGNISSLFQMIYDIVADLVVMDNFYISVLDGDKISIPFIVDIRDNYEKNQLHEDNFPELKHGITSFALDEYVSLMLTKSEIIQLQEDNKFTLSGTMPEQWCFLPFRSTKLRGGISIQSYDNPKQYQINDITLLAYVSTHIGNLLALRNARVEIAQQYDELKQTQVQLVQSEKMASIGQLAAGIAHEINNPLGYVNSNLGSLKGYIDEINAYIGELENHLKTSLDSDLATLKNSAQKVKNKKDELDIPYIVGDINELIQESIFGMNKVKEIVQSLKNFSRIDKEERHETNINDNIEETLKIVWNDLKYKCEVIKELGDIPKIFCYAGQLNQVIMNLLVNAGHAIEEKGTITIRTFHEEETLFIKISDTGKGITKENLKHLFEPFFTTKPVGQGTGLGLSISYGIIEKHNGKILVDSEVGKGTTFTLAIPIEPSDDEGSLISDSM